MTEAGPLPPTPGAPTASATDAERRLHPMSWLFVLLAQLKQFIVPLLALLVFGQGDRNELWPLIGGGVLALVSLWPNRPIRMRSGARGGVRRRRRPARVLSLTRR